MWWLQRGATTAQRPTLEVILNTPSQPTPTIYLTSLTLADVLAYFDPFAAPGAKTTSLAYVISWASKNPGGPVSELTTNLEGWTAGGFLGLNEVRS